jgi:hypothetical protein
MRHPSSLAHAQQLTRGSICLAALASSALMACLPAQAQSSYKFTELKQAAFVKSDVFAINNTGQVIGRLTKATGYQIVPPTFRLETTYSVFATVWSAAGAPTEVPIPSSQRKSAQSSQGVFDINNSGVVVGFSWPTNAPTPVPSKWVNNKVTTLDTRHGSARSVNDAGVIVGVVEALLPSGESRYRATLWRNGQGSDLHALLGLPDTTASVAVAINNRDQVLVTTTPVYGEYGPCYVITGSSVQTLAASAAGQGCDGQGLSDAGVVAGNVWNNTAPYGISPARWVNGSLQRLPTLPVPPDGSLDSRVTSINKDGVIVGSDQGKPVRWVNGVEQVLTTPITGLPSGTALGGIVDISDNGKLLVVFYGSRTSSYGVLAPQP